jgi:hypothetical protein
MYFYPYDETSKKAGLGMGNPGWDTLESFRYFSWTSVQGGDFRTR